HAPYYNIGIVNVDGKPEISEMTQSGYFNEVARWTPDGSAVLFISDRYGMRNHASWGSLSDVMAVFVNKEKFDEFRLNKEDRELLKEAKKNADKKKNSDKADDKKADKKKDKKDKPKEEVDSSKFIKVDREGFADRTVRLTPYSSDVADAIVDPDCETLYYLSAVENGYDLWKVDLVEGGASIASKLGVNGNVYFQADKSGKNIFIAGSGLMKTMPASSAKLKNVTYSSRMKLDRAAERDYMFDKVKNLEREKFYVKDMHGVDWERLTEHYRRFLPHITNNYDFAEMLSEMLGELNVSHTGSGYRASGANETTATLGLLYDFDHKGDGLLVAEVVKGSPFDRAASAVKPGCVIEAINGEPINESTDYTALFNGLVGKKTLVTIRDAAGKTFEEVVKPISGGAMNELLYKRWIRQRADEVERLSGGRLGYVHIRSMGDDSFRDLYSDVLGKYNTCEGIVIDTRWNGGGRLHEDIEVMFSGDKYFTQEVRGEVIGEMPSRRWNKPSIMIQGEANYSNAHGTPWVFKHKGLGKLVGMPVPGTMTSVNWVTLQDPSLYFGIPVTGYRDPNGRFLENQQLEPDIKVANDPATVVKGEDTQLRTAVEELLREIDANKKKK
ncbi:MAG: peptidase S41, partial [Muribaculaceae bacterium]|nr:peptidase S41 [Muribaculaceae bacterium]